MPTYTRARVRFRDDTLRDFANWAARTYGIKRLNVIWRERILDEDGKTSKGCASVFSEGAQYVELSMANTYRKSIDVLVHEIAHVVVIRHCGYAGHGPKFKSFHNAMVARWNSELAEGEKGKR